MRQEIITCDRCGAGDASGLGFAVGRKMDGAGSMEDVEMSADLCFRCTVAVTVSVLQEVEPDWLKSKLSRFRTPWPDPEKPSRPLFREV